MSANRNAIRHLFSVAHVRTHRRNKSIEAKTRRTGKTNFGISRFRSVSALPLPAQSHRAVKKFSFFSSAGDFSFLSSRAFVYVTVRRARYDNSSVHGVAERTVRIVVRGGGGASPKGRFVPGGVCIVFRVWKSRDLRTRPNEKRAPSRYRATEEEERARANRIWHGTQFSVQPTGTYSRHTDVADKLRIVKRITIETLTKYVYSVRTYRTRRIFVKLCRAVVFAAQAAAARVTSPHCHWPAAPWPGNSLHTHPPLPIREYGSRRTAETRPVEFSHPEWRVSIDYRYYGGRRLKI